MQPFASANAVNARTLTLDTEPVPEAQRASGSPATGIAELGLFEGVELGVWEMTEGAMRDVEADEVFVVIAGRASVAIEGEADPLLLEPGVVARLTAGMRTVWTVSEPLRKVWLTPS